MILKVEFEIGSGNVFADLGIPYPEETLRLADEYGQDVDGFREAVRKMRDAKQEKLDTRPVNAAQ